jgi:hypothetical protein
MVGPTLFIDYGKRIIAITFPRKQTMETDFAIFRADIDDNPNEMSLFRDFRKRFKWDRHCRNRNPA